MHLSTKLLLSLSLVLAAMPFAQAEEGGYWRTNAVYVVPEADNADETIGANLALGASFAIPNSENTNQIEIEGGWAKWDTDIGNNTPGSRSDEVTFIPVLVNLRHEIALTDTLRLAIGPSVGASYFKVSGSLTSPAENLTREDWVLSYGGGATFYLTISDSISLSVGYRYLFNDDANLKVNGAKVQVSDLNTHLFELGLRFGWPY